VKLHRPFFTLVILSHESMGDTTVESNVILCRVVVTHGLVK